MSHRQTLRVAASSAGPPLLQEDVAVAVFVADGSVLVFVAAEEGLKHRYSYYE